MEHAQPQSMPHPYWHAPIDPVCGRSIDPIPLPYHASHGDQDYYFCSLRCVERFASDPARYHWAGEAPAPERHLAYAARAVR